MPADNSMVVLPVVQATLVVVSEPREFCMAEKGESHAALVAPAWVSPSTHLHEHMYMSTCLS